MDWWTPTRRYPFGFATLLYLLLFISLWIVKILLAIFFCFITLTPRPKWNASREIQRPPVAVQKAQRGPKEVLTIPIGSKFSRFSSWLSIPRRRTRLRTRSRTTLGYTARRWNKRSRPPALWQVKLLHLFSSFSPFNLNPRPKQIGQSTTALSPSGDNALPLSQSVLVHKVIWSRLYPILTVAWNGTLLCFLFSIIFLIKIGQRALHTC